MKIKMTKRLTAIIIACTLTLAVGTAFAFSPGALDIGANINLATPTYVEWSAVELNSYSLIPSPNPGPPMPAPAYFPLFGHQRAEITEARGRAGQLIEWDLFLYGCYDDDEFIAWGSIMATATNNSERFPMLITAINPVIVLEGDFYDPAVFGLSLDFLGSLDDFLGVLDAGETTPYLWVEVSWDGTWPEGWDYYDIDGYALAATLTLSFTYEIYVD